MKPAGEPDAVVPHVRFDERGWETGRWPLAPKLPRPSSTLPTRTSRDVRFHAAIGGIADIKLAWFEYIA